MTRMNNRRRRKSKPVSVFFITSLAIWTSFVNPTLWAASPGQVVINEHITIRGKVILSKTNGIVLEDAVIGNEENARMRIKDGTYQGDVRGGSIIIDKAHFIQGEIGAPHEKPGQKGYEISAQERVIAQGADLEVSDDLTITAHNEVQLQGRFKVDGELKVQSQNVQITAGKETQEWSESHTDTGFLGLTSSTSVHRENHDTATPTLIEANSVYIKAETLATEATQIKTNQGIRFEARQWLNYPAQNHHCISNEERDSGWFSSSHRNHGHCRTETVHAGLNPGAGKLTLNIQKVEATVGIQPGQSLDQALDQLVSTYPDLLWIKKLRNQHHVQWQTIENNYRGWDDETSGISPLLGVIVSAVVTVATQGMGASFLPAAMSSNLIATNAANAAFSTLVAKSAVDLANNGGDISQTVRQLFSEDTIKTVAVDTIAGGLMGSANTPYLVSPSAPVAQRIQSFGVRIASRTGAGIIVEGSSPEDQFTSSLNREAWQELAAQANYWAGDYARSRDWKEGDPAKIALHSSVGAVLGELKDGKPLAGAIAGGTAQATEKLTEELSHEVQEITSTIFAAIAAQLAGGDSQTGAWIGQTQHQYNRELHREEAGFLQKQIEGLDEEQQARWLAAVCHKVHCSHGLSSDDPHYDTFKTLELVGSDYTAELTQLETSELFTYTGKDATEDFLSRQDKGITRFTGIVQTLAGVGGAAGSAAGGAVLCVSGVGCGLGALISSAGMTAGIEEYREGIDKLTTEYTANQGNRITASFHPETHPGEQSRVDELGRVAVVAAAELAVGRLGLQLAKAPEVQKLASKEAIPVEKVAPYNLELRQTGGGFADSADELYDAIRASDSDVSKIAQNTGIKPENIQKVKDHIFYNEHLLDKYIDYGIPAERARFDSNLNQAMAWQRLEAGTHSEADITWLRHETAEHWHELKHNSGYSESHNAAERKWPGNPWEEN